MPTGQYTDADAVAPPSAGRYTDADVLPEQSISAAASEYGHKMLEAGKGIWNAGVSAAKHLLPGGGNDAPADIATAGVRFLINHHTEQEKILSDAEDSAKKGDWGGFFRNLQAWGINSSVPGFGTAVKEASDKWDQGDKAGAIADGAALVTQQALLQKAPDIAAGTVAGARAVGAGIKAGAPDVLGGGAKVIAGEALAKVPGMEYPARIGLGYPGARQIGKGMGKFGEAFGESLSPTPAKASPAAPAAGAAAAAPAAETLADGSTVQDIARGQGIKSWKNATADQKAGAQGIFDKLKAAEAAAPTSAAEAPPPSPTPSAPRVQPTSAAPTVLQPNGGPLRPPLAPQPAAAAPSVVSAVRPETPPNVVQMPKAANTTTEATPTFTGQRLVPYQDLWKTPLRQAAGEPQPLLPVKEQLWHPEEFAKGEAYQRLMNEHLIAVRDALEAGKPVPAEVLADYPQLQKQAAAVSPETQDLDWSVFQGDEPPVKSGLTKDAYKGAARGTRADRAGSLANILDAAGTAADDLNSMSLKQWQDLAAAHDIDLPTTKAAQSKLFFDTKMALRQREIDRAGTGGMIKPLPGFSMGEMKNYRAQPATAAPSAVPSAAPAELASTDKSAPYFRKAEKLEADAAHGEAIGGSPKVVQDLRQRAKAFRDRGNELRGQ